MTFVLPVYNNEDEVKNFIDRQLLRQTFIRCKIYVVVNEAKVKIEIEDDRVTILKPGKNLGYLGALRYVIESIDHSFDYITLCNTDIDLKSTSFLKEYLDVIQHKIFGVAAPMIRSTLTRAGQNPIYTNRLPLAKIKLLRTVYKYYFLFVLYQMLFYAKRILGRHPVAYKVNNPYALHGSFFTISADYFKAGGTVNYPVLLYGEELFLAEEAHRIMLPNLLCTDLEILHNEHSTTGICKSREQVEYLSRSIDYIYKTYYA